MSREDTAWGSSWRSWRGAAVMKSLIDFDLDAVLRFWPSLLLSSFNTACSAVRRRSP